MPARLQVPCSPDRTLSTEVWQALVSKDVPVRNYIPIHSLVIQPCRRLVTSIATVCGKTRKSGRASGASPAMAVLLRSLDERKCPSLPGTWCSSYVGKS